MKNLILVIAVVLAAPAFAGTQPVNVSGTPFEGSILTFTENEFGPQLDGLTFAVNGKEAVGIFFGGRKKQWCAVIKDEKEGTGLDCGFLNKGGDITAWVTGKPEKKAVVQLSERTVKLSWADSPRYIQLKGSIEVDAASRVATARLEVSTWESEKSVHASSHTVGGIYISASAQIRRDIGKFDNNRRNPAKTN